MKFYLLQVLHILKPFTAPIQFLLDPIPASASWNKQELDNEWSLSASCAAAASKDSAVNYRFLFFLEFPCNKKKAKRTL